MTTPRRIRVAYSPDADDAFMAYGLAVGAVDTRGLSFERVEADIETLNRRAREGELEVTAISFAAWPGIAETYDLLPVGSSFGLGYGPRLVTARPATLGDVAGGVVAIPGENTTAALVLRLCSPGVRTQVVPFESIPEAVVNGDVDAGVVIHESQLTHADEGLHLVLDFGEWWAGATGDLPLPLGGNVIRRDLDEEVTRTVRDVLRDSIEHALAHREEAVRHALAFGRGLDVETGDRYVSMYVNDLTLDPGERGREAVDVLFSRARAAELIPPVTPRWAC